MTKSEDRARRFLSKVRGGSEGRDKAISTIARRNPGFARVLRWVNRER